MGGSCAGNVAWQVVTVIDDSHNLKMVARLLTHGTYHVLRVKLFETRVEKFT